MYKDKKKKGILISIIGFCQGGAEIMPIRIANELHRMGYKVGIHCLNKGEDTMVRSFLEEGIPVYYTDRAFTFGLLLLTKRYDVIHTHCVASQQLVARTKRKMPFLSVYHVATSHGGYEGLDEKEAHRVIREVDAAVNVWTYVAENNKETFVSAGIAQEKLVKIGNAIRHMGAINPLPLSTYGIPEDAIVFTVITRAVWKKCWRECIDTIAEARKISGKNIHLILGGTGPVYEELIKEDLEEYIHLIGAVSDPCGLYRSSYCGLLLSVRECAPLGIIEMYQAGIPVVATDTGDVREMVETEYGASGTVVPLADNGKVSIKKSAEAVAEMIENSAYYEQCAINASKNSGNYRIEKIVEKYLHCYGFRNFMEKI